MSHNSEASVELGAAHNMGMDPHIRPHDDAQNDEAPQAQVQQLAADDRDAPADDTGINSPVLSDNEDIAQDSHRPVQRSRSSAHTRSTRNDAFAPVSGHDSPAENDDDEEDDVQVDDARTRDEDWEPSTSSTRRTPRHTSSTYHPPTEERTFSSNLVQALQAARPKKWDKNNIPPYRDHLMSEMSRRIKDLERIMSRFVSPEVDYDNRSDPTEVQKWAEKAVRRISDHLQELREVKRDIDDLNAYWLHWLWSISPTHLDREKTLRDQYIDADDEGGFASVCRRYEARYRRLRAGYGDAKDAVTWSKAQIEQQWKMELAQIARGSRTPTPAPTVEIPERAADGTTTTMPATEARTDAHRTNAVPAASHVSTAETASRPIDTTNDFENRVIDLGLNTLGKVASLHPSSTSTSTLSTDPRSFGDSSNAHTSLFGAPPTADKRGLNSSTFGANTVQSKSREPMPRQSLFDYGGGFRRAGAESTRANNERTDTAAHTSHSGQTRPHIRFAAENDVFPIPPRERQQRTIPRVTSREEQLRQSYTPVASQQQQPLFDSQYAQTRTMSGNAQSQSASANSQTRTTSDTAQSQSTSANSQTTTSSSTAQDQTNTASAQKRSTPPPTRARVTSGTAQNQTQSAHAQAQASPAQQSPEMSALLSILQSQQGILQSLQLEVGTLRAKVDTPSAAAPQTATTPVATTATSTIAGTPMSSTPVTVTTTMTPPRLSVNAHGTHVIPLPAPPTADGTPTAPVYPGHTAAGLALSYGMFPKSGSDFGDGIRVSAMDGRNLTPAAAIDSPVGPKPPTGLPSGSTPLTGGNPHTPTHFVNSVRYPEPKPFFGEYFDWPRFSSEWANFVNSTRPDPFSLMALLKKLLKGNAETTAQRYDGQSTEEYDDLWKALVARFHRKDQVIKHYLNSFHEIRAPTRETIPELRVLHGDTCVAVSRLKRAGKEVDDDLYAVILMKKVQTDKLRDFLRERQQEAQQAGRDWHTTAILDAMEVYIQRMEEREADMREFGQSRYSSPRPQRTFLLQDGKRLQVNCADEDLAVVDAANDGHLPDARDAQTPYGQSPTPRTPSPQHQNVHATYGEYQKKEFGKRSTPANYAPSPRPPHRGLRKGPKGRNQTPRYYPMPR